MGLELFELKDKVAMVTGSTRGLGEVAALASPATRYLDLDGHLDLARDLVTGGFVLQDGELGLTDNPGLGVKLLADD